MPWARASSLDRLVACPGSATVEVVGDVIPEARLAARWGTRVHAWKETGEWPDAPHWQTRRAQERRDAALAAGAITRDLLWPAPGGYGRQSGGHEVALALNTKSRIVAKHEGSREEQAAWKASWGDEWAVGTADWLGEYLLAPWVDDLKTGNPDYLPADPWDSWQMRFYGTCWLMLTGAPEVVVSLTSWPQSPADGLPDRSRLTTVSSVEVLGLTLPLLEAARQAVLASREGPPQLARNPHCGFCPGRLTCPEHQPDPERFDSEAEETDS